ncbi:helix-turn-helix DNA-binding protein [Streptomyces phage Satis]|nr:helix-turn-helix DNA-binding protein [Streptomyces phage Satis]QBZ71999.1 helix-turn-helix DNA-binding protein [Streptomyces phage Kradal]QPL14418.1 helix-turn-helix DNA-binding domain protein [Streptomyces phage EhyElimayoE]
MTDQIPKYRAIARHYRSQVTSGTLEPGTPLESRRKLAKQHGTSRVTIDKVVELLTAEGILEPSDGNRPPIVADISLRTATVQDRVGNAAATGRALGAKEKTRILRVEAVPCPSDIAPLLGVQAGDEVILRERVNLIDDKPVATGHSYYPPEVSDATPELRIPQSIPSGSRELAAERMGSRQKDLIPVITSRLATDRERELLELKGAYVVVTQTARRILLANGKVVEVAVKICEGSRPVSFHIPL